MLLVFVLSYQFLFVCVVVIGCCLGRGHHRYLLSFPTQLASDQLRWDMTTVVYHMPYSALATSRRSSSTT